MPLIKGKSPKAFEHNVKAEMHAGKPQKQALAIAYATKRRANKAMGGYAEGGQIQDGHQTEAHQCDMCGGYHPARLHSSEADGHQSTDYEDCTMGEGNKMEHSTEYQTAKHENNTEGSPTPYEHSSTYQTESHEKGTMDGGNLETHSGAHQSAEFKPKDPMHTSEKYPPGYAHMAEGGDIEDTMESQPDVSAMGAGRSDLVGRVMAKRMSEGGKVANQDHGPMDSRLAGFDQNEFDDLALRDDLEFSYTGANSGDEDRSEGEDKRREDIVARIMKSRAKKDRMP